jgi:hypothetical protein
LKFAAVKPALALAAILLMLAATAFASDGAACKSKPEAGACFSFHGRLALYNGGHAYWIWQVGKQHRYWVEQLPPGAEKDVDWDHYYWGDFDVCPTTKFQQGRAQGICVRAVRNLRATVRK